MHFSNDINVGNLVAAAAVILALWQFHLSNIKRIHRIQFRVSLMWKQFAHRFDLPENLDDLDNDNKDD